MNAPFASDGRTDRPTANACPACGAATVSAQGRLACCTCRWCESPSAE